MVQPLILPTIFDKEREREQHSLRQLLGGAQAARMIQEVQAGQMERQDEATLRDALSGVGGDFTKAQQVLMQQGKPLLAAKLSKLNEVQKPQLVEVADPNDPSKILKQWVVPGESKGVTIGSAPQKETIPAIVNTMRAAGVDPQSPQGQALLRDYLMKQVTHAPAPSATAIVKSDNKYAETVGGKAAERDVSQHEAAAKSVDNVLKLNELIDHLDSSDAITGMGAEMLLNLQRVQQLFLKDKASGKKISDTEYLDAMLGSDVFPMIGALGIGARGLDTPAEREFLRKVMTGTIEMNKDTLRRMALTRRNIAQRALDRWNKRVEKGELDNYFQFSNTPKEKINVPSAVESEPSGWSIRKK